ncbi:hypothetical protein JRO89_XS11G0007500 [Xanthoceras sorbifolium]|uniref:DUF4378 domain-containing protein n=1 Tax=Xanthoceras sorbifolium TaxID=99658 RepID=A0ABQ8HE13_9ROSI|nr:hypothetical protein JRO89_XS11G0007500 [Xanthoceras sorbifolium]
MNETAGKTSSCLSIAEKRTTTHRPGGCVGIFFQLFDWNRRLLAKKKLFSRKLLPPARAKQVSKKFGGDEKMPKTKFHLIADENSGGFPNVKRNGKNSSTSSLDLEPKHEMRAPGLVARLMGLESMPTVQKDKPKKPSFAGSRDVREEDFVNEHGGFNREDLSSEKGNGKTECRPQKLQKTGQFERRAVTRFGAEALQIKGVLSRSRKHQHPRLASPVKSPRVSSGRNMSRTSRLIDAATKILEPGLQATNRAKCALTSSSSTHCIPNYEVLTEERMGIMSPDLSKQSGCNASAGKSSMGQTSCRNCGNLPDVVDSRTNTCSTSNLVNISSPGLGKSKPRSPISSVDKERDENFKQQEQPTSLAVLEKDDNSIQSVNNTLNPVRKIPSQEGQDQWHLTSKQCKSQKEEPSFTFNQRTQTQNRMSLSRDGIPSRAKLTNLPSSRVSSAANTISGAKDFVALNRNLSGRTRPRVPAKLDNSTLEAERKSVDQQDDSLAQLRTPVRKRRTVSVNGQAESTVFVKTTRGRQRNVTTGKQVGVNAHSMNHTPIKSRAACHGDGNRANGNKDNDVISFTFSSPLRRNSEIPTEIKGKIEDQNNFVSKSNFYRMDKSDGASSLRKKMPLSGDALGVLLEEKLKELSSQEEDELTTTGTQPKRSTAMILQELISALTMEQPISCDADVFSTDMPSQTKENANGTSVGFVCDGNHLSPGSVLEASFSNDSCLSSSLDDNSGHRLHLDSADYSEYQPQRTEPDADLLDSATSISKGSTGNQMVNDLINQISKLLHGINHAGLGLTGSKLTHTKDVILNAELLFGNTSLHNSDGMKDFLVAPFLLDELEVLASAMWSKFNCLLGFEGEAKDGNQLRGFLFDCLIEFFNAKYGRYCNSGFNTWTRLPLRMKAEMLIREVGEEVIRWTHLAEITVDEIIECDMSHSLGKWTDFDIEAFETGAVIGRDILQILVEETVTDLYECRMVCNL